MGPMDLHFNYKDIFRAPRIALSGKKIWIFMSGNLAGFASYWILTYLALSFSGLPTGNMIEKYGLYPSLFGNSHPWFSWVIYFCGCLTWIISILLSYTAVSRVTIKQLKGNDFFSSNDSWSFVHKYWHPVVFTSFTILLIILFFLVFATIFALICNIPYIGALFYVLPYPLYIIGSVFTVYTGIVFLISIFYAPAIVGTYEEDTMGTVFQTYAITWSQPWRIIAYNLLIWPLAYLGITIFSWFYYASIGLMNHIFGFIIGESLNNIFTFSSTIVFPSNVLSWINSYVRMADLTYLLPDVGQTASNLSLIETFSGIILALFLFLMILSVFSYGCSIIAVSRTLEFIIFKKISDDDNLLDRKDEDELNDDDDFTFEEGIGLYDDSDDSEE